ncbi:MAG: hypothetical protein K8E66_07860 [Phycisphaerales bacterium]|nr:hypothetical protein [Phycisphaerales bacterium]
MTLLPCGDELPVQVCLRNNGSATSGQASVTIYLRRTCGSGTQYQIGQFNTGFWGAGDSGTYTARPTLPCNSLITGCFTVIAEVSVSGDTNPSNNRGCSGSQICIEDPGSPDAAVADIQFNPSSPTVGQSVQITAIIENVGDATAENVDIEYYIDGVYLGDDDTTPIDPGDTDSESISWTPTSPGPHEICVEIIDVDPSDANSGNNTRCETINVIDPYDLASLSVEPVSPGSTYDRGDNLPIGATVANVGGQTSPGYTATFTLEPGNRALCSQGRSAIGPGGSSSFTANCTVPMSTPAGTYTIEMCVSPGGSTSGNDCDLSVGTVTIPPFADPYDLAAASVEPVNPGAEYEPGGTVPISATVMNLGDDPSPVYDATFVLMPGSRALCAESRGAVSGNSTDAFTASCVIPAGTPAGDYTIQMCLSPGGDSSGNDCDGSGGEITIRPAQPNVLEDDFADGVPEPLWTTLAQNGALLRVLEQNGRFEVEGSVNLFDELVAGYFGEEWGLDTTQPWAFDLRWHFGAPSLFDNGDVGLTIVLLFNGDLGSFTVTDGVIVSIGRDKAQGQAVYDYYFFSQLLGGVEIDGGDLPRDNGGVVQAGTVGFSYNPTTDVLTISDSGLGGQFDLTDFRANSGGANTIQIFIGGFSTGPTDAFGGDDAWMDDFRVTAGVVVDVTNVPEPCNPADLTEPYETFDLADILAFIGYFGGTDPLVDFVEPFGVWDLADIIEFIRLFNEGCPG